MNLGLDGRCWSRRRDIKIVGMGVSESGRFCRSGDTDDCG